MIALEEAVMEIIVNAGQSRSLCFEALHAARGHPGLADAWVAGDGLALRRQQVADGVAQRGLTAVTCHTERVRERTQSRPRS